MDVKGCLYPVARTGANPRHASGSQRGGRRSSTPPHSSY